MSKVSPADEWLELNDKKRFPNGKRRFSKRERKQALQGKLKGISKRTLVHGNQSGSKKISRRSLLTIKQFVESVRNTKSEECVFVPGSIKGIPARMNFFERQMTAAKYSLLLKAGTPPKDKEWALHACGNGHLSCVNPNHLYWGDRSDNVSDQGRHRSADTQAVQERIESVDNHSFNNRESV